jgi:hypothetical protein
MYGMCSSASSASTFEKADRLKGNTGANLLFLLESRLDNVVYRMGFGSTRAEAQPAGLAQGHHSQRAIPSTFRPTWSRPVT